MSSMSGAASSRISLNQRSDLLCTARPRTSDPPFGSGRPAPYLNHHFAEQFRKVFAWLGDRISPRVSFLVVGDAAGALPVDAAGTACLEAAMRSTRQS